ncbi:protein of unknown function [Caballeronia sp. S22]
MLRGRFKSLMTATEMRYAGVRIGFAIGYKRYVFRLFPRAKPA